jgi:AcrR family transcriptional regulator
VPEPAGSRSEKDAAILATAREILAELGVDGLTIEGVAVRSGIAKTTIYRRYRSKQDLALAVVLAMTEEVVAKQPDGDTRALLIGLLDTAASLLRDTNMGRVMQGLVSDIATNASLSGPYQKQIVDLRVQRFAEIVRFGIGRGELRPDADPAFLHELMFGPLYYRLLLSGRPLDADFAERIVDAVLPAFVPPVLTKGRLGHLGEAE